jgi:5-(carboxyamino)imidazole ribonucleotide synthase
VVGVIGGGQLGRYFVLEARRLGYQTWVLDPDPAAPAMQLAEHTLAAPYDDAAALQQLAQTCDAVTVEFENVPAASLELIASHCRVAPSAASIRIAQDRDLEKQTAEKYGLKPVPYRAVVTADDIVDAVESVGLPAILKTSRLGYDGKGQVLCASRAAVEQAFAGMQQAACVLERRIELAAEISVVLARGYDASIAVFPIARNVHVNGILSTSTVPAEVSEQVLDDARAQAIRLAQGLDYHGVLAVEFFVDEAGQVLFNEMAPRPHNSGHYTLDATVCSQFEQQLRALCGLPLGVTTLLSPVCMMNLLGDVWSKGQPDWHSVLQHGGAQLHLYGKQQARPGRKMGHINCLDVSADAATAAAQYLMERLGG